MSAFSGIDRTTAPSPLSGETLRGARQLTMDLILEGLEQVLRPPVRRPIMCSQAIIDLFKKHKVELR